MDSAKISNVVLVAVLLAFGAALGFWFGDLGGGRNVVLSAYDPATAPPVEASGWCCLKAGAKCVQAPKGGLACLKGAGLIYNVSRDRCDTSCAQYNTKK